MTTPADQLLAVQVLELEAAAAVMLADAGFPADLTRAPFPHEVASRTSYAGLEDDVRQAAAEIAGMARASRGAAIDLVLAELATAPDALSAIAIVDELAAALRILPGGADLASALFADVYPRLVTLANTAATRIVDDMRAAGITVTGTPTLRPGSLPPIEAATRRVAAEAVAAGVRAVRGAVYATRRDQPVDRFVAAAAEKAHDTGTAGLDDVASQSALRANGEGRLSGLDEIAEPERVELYASELLDRNTCRPCASIDGTAFDTREAAEAAYPGGRYIDCQGGDRCRGTLVVVNAGESAATLPVPGDGSRATRTDRQRVDRPGG